MADDDAEKTRSCAPCRGTGQVMSAKGGELRPVECPWCDGTGRMVPGHDAQARARATAR